MPINYAEFAKSTLVDQLGNTGEDIFSRVIIKKPLNEKSSVGDISDFITTVERIVSVVSGKEKATEIALLLRGNIQETAKKTIQKEGIENLNSELENFLKKHILPRETDIIDYAKFQTLKIGGNAKKMEIEIASKVRDHLKKVIFRKRINEEIITFLGKYTNPQKSDIDDFINYVKMMNINYPDDELRENIEKTRLFLKFQQKAIVDKSDEIDQFVGYIKSNSDKDALANLLQKEGFGYLIKDEKGISDKYMIEVFDLIAPGEKETK